MTDEHHSMTLEDARERERAAKAAWDAVKAAKAAWDAAKAAKAAWAAKDTRERERAAKAAVRAAWKAWTEIAARRPWVLSEDDDEDILTKAKGE